MAEAEAQAVEEQQVESQEAPELQDAEQEEQFAEQTEDVGSQDEVRKWQSMYDRAQAENAKMQNAMTEYLRSQNQAQEQTKNVVPTVTEDEFNPWEAYYKPDSPSYQMRMQNESSLVHDVVDQKISRLQNDMSLNNTRNELRQLHNMNDNDINEFMSFVAQPKDSVPVSSLVKLWRDTTGRSGNASNVAIPRTKQQAPRTAGTQSNQGPVRKSDETKAWDGILKSGATGRLP